MEGQVLQDMNEEWKEQLAKRKKSLLRYAVPEDRCLENALNTLTKAELDDIRYNLCVQGISSLKKREMAAALVPAIVEFSYKWFVTIGSEQYGILNKIAENGGVSAQLDENDVRMDYMRCMGLVFSGSQDGKQAWYMPDELLAIYTKLDKARFKQAVSLNEEVVRLATGLLFYYGYLAYDVLYEKVTGYIKEDLEFIDFMGILINAGCWQDNIVNVDTGMHYYTVIDYEKLAQTQIMRKDLDFRALAYEEAYRAGEAEYIEDTDEYKALVGFFMKEFSLPVLTAADIVGELLIILLNDQNMGEMIEYIQSVAEIPGKEAAGKMVALLTAFNNSAHLWSLKGYSANELEPERKQAASPYTVKSAPNNVIQFVPLSSSVGRNDPCPCGSGKKYKKCCMGKEI